MMDGIEKRRMTYECALPYAGRTGGLYTDWVSLRLSSLLTVALFTSVHPSLVTLANLAVGVTASLLAILAVGVEPTWISGLLVALGWQLAFVLDCADGQIARASGKTSSFGAILDILCDFAVQSSVVAAVCVAVSHDYDVPPALLPLFAATWMVNLIVTVLLRASDEDSHRPLPSRSPILFLFRQSRDYGFLVLVLGISYAFWRPLLPIVVVAVLAMNLIFLAAMIAIETRLSIIATRSSPSVDLVPLETAARQKRLGALK